MANRFLSLRIMISRPWCRRADCWSIHEGARAAPRCRRAAAAASGCSEKRNFSRFSKRCDGWPVGIGAPGIPGFSVSATGRILKPKKRLTQIPDCLESQKFPGNRKRRIADFLTIQEFRLMKRTTLASILALLSFAAAEAADVFVPGKLQLEFWQDKVKEDVEGGTAGGPTSIQLIDLFEFPTDGSN